MLNIVKVGPIEIHFENGQADWWGYSGIEGPKGYLIPVGFIETEKNETIKFVSGSRVAERITTIEKLDYKDPIGKGIFEVVPYSFSIKVPETPNRVSLYPMIKREESSLSHMFLVQGENWESTDLVGKEMKDEL